MAHHSSGRRTKPPASRRRTDGQFALSDRTKPASPAEPAGGDDGKEDGLPGIEMGGLEPAGPVDPEGEQTEDAKEVDEVEHNSPEHNAHKPLEDGRRVGPDGGCVEADLIDGVTVVPDLDGKAGDADGCACYPGLNPDGSQERVRQPGDAPGKGGDDPIIQRVEQKESEEGVEREAEAEKRPF